MNAIPDNKHMKSCSEKPLCQATPNGSLVPMAQPYSFGKIVSTK